MAHVGVRNRTQDKQVLTYDGKSIYFEPGQVRLVESVSPDFIETRIHVFHPTKMNKATGLEEKLQAVHGLRLFDVLTIDEALKLGARPDEDPRIIAARRAEEQKKQERKELLAELKTSLVEDGWTPPAAKATGGKLGEEGADHVEL